MSNRQIRTLKRTKGIFLDGAPVYANCVVRAGQVLGAVCESPYDQGHRPAGGPLRVLYADEDLLLVDKPAPMATLPTRGKPLGTLANLVAAYEGRTPFLFRPVNRLDRGTSGIVVAARHALAQKRLMESLHHARLPAGVPRRLRGDRAGRRRAHLRAHRPGGGVGPAPLRPPGRQPQPDGVPASFFALRKRGGRFFRCVCRRAARTRSACTWRTSATP